MSSDFMQDIVPPERPQEPAEQERSDDGARIPIRIGNDRPADSERSIRNISAPVRSRMIDRAVPPPPRRPRRARSWLIWAVAVVVLIVLGALLLLSLRGTSVSIMPKSYAVAFDSTAHFTAYPAASAASGMLSYTVHSSDIEDSEVVPATGTARVESKASGTITVFNSYSAQPVKLVKNTRFATPDGLIFKVPSEVVIPGMNGSTPGSVSVSVIADQVGSQYNVGPTAKFTLPGLKTKPTMYSHVYASSKAAMSGGYSGNAPAVDPGVEASTRAQIRSRLEAKANTTAAAASPGMLLLAPQITYQSLPNTTESGGVGLHERAHIDVIELPTDAFAAAVAQTIGLDTGNAPLQLSGTKYALTNDATSTALGTDPLHLTASGSVLLVWQVDTAAVAKALAGVSSGSFDKVVASFPSIQEAHARIEPFWNSTFPANPSTIKVRIEAPKTQ